MPPPVINTVFPLAESSGRVGDKDGYVSECHFEVGDGKGAAIVSVRSLAVLDDIDSEWKKPCFRVASGRFYTCMSSRHGHLPCCGRRVQIAISMFVASHTDRRVLHQGM